MILRILISLLFVAGTTLLSFEPTAKKPEVQGSTGYGWEYYFSFIPTWDKGKPESLKIYITSALRTKVTVKIVGKGYEKIKYTIPNDFVEFSLSAEIGQVYTKSEKEAPLKDSVFEKMGIYIVAEDPIACYAITRHQNSSDGFIITGMRNIGKDYIISSYADHGDNINEWYPGYVAITAAYDKTKVRFYMGGNDSSRTSGGLNPGDSSLWNMNKGDVLLIASEGHGSDLSGSRVSATKPVAVTSGNFCAEIPIGATPCDIFQSMEMPINAWGKEYLVPSISGRKTSSIIKVFARKPETTVYMDNNPIGIIKSYGGKEGEGFISIRAGSSPQNPTVISADNEISVTQYNSSSSDDEQMSHPFQWTITPFEQFAKEIAFPTPGLNGGYGFNQNYLSICYEPTEYGAIPMDLEIALVHAGTFAWQKIAELSPEPGTPYLKLSNGKQYYSKYLSFDGGWVYRIRSAKPIAVYVYGNSHYTSYGYPAVHSPFSDVTLVDTIAPVITFTQECSEYLGSVTDIDNNNPTSKISVMYMQSDVSYNFKLEHDDFMPCEDDSVNWSLEIIDCTEDALAGLIFMDCAGNMLDTTIEYFAPKLEYFPESITFKDLQTGVEYDTTFWIYNKAEKAKLEINELNLALGNQEFKVFDKDFKTIALPLVIEPMDSVMLNLRYTANSDGRLRDTLIIVDTCCYNERIPLSAYTTGTGINNTRETEIKIFPNPTKNILFIENLPYFCNELQVYNILGSRIESFVLRNNNDFNLNVSEFQDGIYYLRILSGKEIFYYKFTVIH